MDGDELIDEDYDEWVAAQERQEWSIIYSKKPELIIDKDEYDKVLVNLLMSYQEFKKSINDMDQLKQLRNDEIRDSETVDNSKQRRKIKREPKKIRKFFNKLFANIKQEVKIEDVKFNYDQFLKYARIVSNNEIELIDGGDNTKLKAHLKKLWKTLAEELENVEKEASMTEEPDAAAGLEKAEAGQ